MSTSNTHLKIDPRLCGRPLELGEGRARVAFEPTPEMAADERGLVHGGFVFGAADYAAMLAVNHPNVVLGAAEVRFSLPCRVGEELIAEAERQSVDKRRHSVEVRVLRGSEEVLSGSFTCFVLDRHVLD
jgi:acyl-coenzyme A thioesterase PaaI-like protein